MKTYSTKQIADLVGVHSNTVRLYEKWGHISPAERRKNNYRVFTDKHLDEMRLARLAFPGPYPVLSKPLFNMMYEFNNCNYQKALHHANDYYYKVMSEIKTTNETLKIMDHWYLGQVGSKKIIATGRLKFANLVNVTVDTIRTWERNNIYKPEFDNRVKQYSEFDLEKVKVIRLLRKRGFSIATLEKVFNHSVEILPSNYLTNIYYNNETTYEADEWVNHLKEHREKSKKIISFIEKKINSNSLTI